MRLKMNRTVKLLLSLVTGISVLTMGAVPQAFAANTVSLPGVSAPVLTPESQAATAWQNTIPNALADYYTYVPYSNADAVALGFPATCGNKALTTAADVASTADCYTISVRQVVQPTSLDFLKYVGIPGFPGAGLLDELGVPLSDTADPASAKGFLASAVAGKLTTAWGYGSGGTGWKPNFPAGPVVTGNAPPPFQGVPFAALFGPGYNGDTTATGVWHFPAPTIKGTTGRPVYVQWLNDLPNIKPQGHDPSVDCGIAAHLCYPYNRIVTHVHGAHVNPESDGLAVAWYTPNFALYGEGKFPDDLYVNTAPGKPIYSYPMTQEAGTIWYHDHAVGTTHLNTNNGMAGFFPITDTNEQARIAEGTLPKPQFDNGFALQDRHFNTKGQMVMPDYATYDLTTPDCMPDPGTGLADPNTCTRLQWAKVLTADTVSTTDLKPVVKLVPMDSPEGKAATTLADPSYDLNFPAGCTEDLKNSFEGISLAGAPFTQCAPFPATSATLEYFGNMPVVNGVTYGNFNLEARVQRMRFIGGTDSRTWIMQLVKKGAVGTATDCGTPAIVGGCTVYAAADIVKFYQIGSEQGFLDKPVPRDYITLMGGERVDVLVDFTGVAPGTQFTLANLGDDAPFSGNFDFANLATRQPTSVEIPEIMQFTVIADTIAVTPNSAAPSALAVAAGSPLRVASPLTTYPAPTAGEPVRTVALIEITDQYGRTMPTIDARGYIPPGMMTTEYIKLNNTEYWDIVNTTVDAHPMHIHQVAFRALYRESIGSFAPPYSNTITKVFSQPSYTALAGSQVAVDPWDAGWKDTIQVIPGTAVRVIATWDLEGEYVWHCHILSHEEHDMMRPFMVVTASGVAAPASLTAAVDNTQGTVTLAWPAVFGATGYVIHQSTDNFVTSSYAVTTGPVTQAVLKNMADGTYTFRIAAILVSAQTGFTTNATPVTVAKTVAAPASVTAPTLTYSGLVPVSWAASTTPDFFASATGGLYYPLQYLVTYDVTATDTTTLAAYTITGLTTTSATFGVTPDANTGAVLPPLPVGTYTISVVANLASWNPSLAATAVNTTTVAVPAAITTIAPAALAAASVNAPYSVTFTANGGPAPLIWSATGLPASLTMSAAGVISGTPTPADVPTGASATFPVSVTVKDSLDPLQTMTVALSLVVNQVLPAAPTLMTATAFGSTQVNLTWVDNANNEAGFTIQRATNATFTGALVTFAALPANTTTYSDLTAVAGATYYYRVASTNALGSSAFAVSPLVKPAVLAITTTVLPASKVNLAYTATLAAKGGAAPYTWSAVGLPASLTINPATGVISGVPTPADVPAGALSATFPVTVTVQDSLVPAPVATTLVPLNLSVNQVLPAAPTLLTAAAFGMNQVNLAWVDNSNNEAGFTLLRATDAAYTLGLTAVALPANTTTYTDTTVLAGIAYYYKIASNNIVGTSAYAAATPRPVRTLATLAVTPVVLPAATVNLAYPAKTLAATGGLAPYTWSATGLPAGMTMTAAGVISGIPAPANVPTGAPVTFPVTVTVTDSFATAQTASVVINLVVNQALPKAPTLMTAALVGTTQINLAWVDNSNNETGFTVVRATDALFTLGLVTVAVPANTTVYTDTTALPGTAYYYRVASSNGLGISTYALATPRPIRTLAPLAITTAALKNGTVNAAYTVTLKATGGRVPYTWSATGLPAGLTIAPATGIISGIPTIAPTLLTATFPVAITVTDGVSTPAAVTLNMIVNQVKPAVPALLTAVAASPTQVNLSWTDSSTNIAGYTLQRSTVANFAAAKTVTTVLPAGSTLYSDITAVTKTIYYYRINATNAAGVSAYSVATTVTTP